MKGFIFVFLISLALLIFATACGGGASDEVVEDQHTEDEHMDDEHMDDEEDEHMEDEMGVMDHGHVEVPDEFASLANPFDGDTDAITVGQEIFTINCATCHGPTGAGDGAAAVGLDPKPADLGDNEMMVTLTDGYLFWRVTKGGVIEPFNSAMPSWEQGLTEEQRWQVISYVRTFTEQ
jgi:mono/diheme cytochrome c family protein